MGNFSGKLNRRHSANSNSSIRAKLTSSIDRHGAKIVAVEDEDTITLRRISHPANRGLIDLLLACPTTFEIIARERDDTEPLSL